MTATPAPQGVTSTVPPPSVNGSAPPPVPPSSAPKPPPSRRAYTRISGIHIGLIAGTVGLIVVMIFIIQNAQAVNIRFLGAQLRLPLAVAMFLAAIAGALVMAAAGTARITQLRSIMRRDRRRSQAS